MKAKHLVIGGDSLLGRAIVERLRASGEAVAATTRRRENVAAAISYLDLNEDVSGWGIPCVLSTSD